MRLQWSADRHVVTDFCELTRARDMALRHHVLQRMQFTRLAGLRELVGRSARTPCGAAQSGLRARSILQ